MGNNQAGLPLSQQERGPYNPIGTSGMTITSATKAGLTANVSLSGNVNLLGACFDAAYEAQIVLNVLNLMRVNNANITLNGQNLRSYIDMSGNADPNYVYTRGFYDLPSY